MSEQIRIPLSLHCFRYLQIEFQDSSGDLYLTEKDKFCQYFLGMLEKRDFPRKQKGIALRFQERNAHRDYRYAAANISEANAQRIDRLIEHMMFRELFSVLSYIDRSPGRSARYGKKKPVILFFCETYDPEGEILNYDMVNERYKRYRKKKALKKGKSDPKL